MPGYIDIHTHHLPSPINGNISVLNLYKDFEQAKKGVICSLGLHPWYLENWEKDFELLQEFAALPNVVAIGECGLDKLCKTDWHLQVTVFKKQIYLANSLDKPLVIHCVRAFPELIGVLQISPNESPVIIHGYNNKESTGQVLLDKGYYLSFGSAILKPDSPAAGFLAQIDADRFLLETDDSRVDIKEIYRSAALIRKCSEDELILQVEHNYKTVFNQ